MNNSPFEYRPATVEKDFIEYEKESVKAAIQLICSHYSNPELRLEGIAVNKIIGIVEAEAPMRLFRR